MPISHPKHVFIVAGLFGIALAYGIAGRGDTNCTDRGDSANLGDDITASPNRNTSNKPFSKHPPIDSSLIQGYVQGLKFIAQSIWITVDVPEERTHYLNVHAAKKRGLANDERTNHSATTISYHNLLPREKSKTSNS